MRASRTRLTANLRNRHPEPCEGSKGTRAFTWILRTASADAKAMADKHDDGRVHKFLVWRSCCVCVYLAFGPLAFVISPAATAGAHTPAAIGIHRTPNSSTCA